MNQTVFVSLQLHRERSWLISTNLFDSSVFLLTVVQPYIHSAYMEGTPHPKPHTHPLFFFFLIYIYSFHHKPVQEASGSSWACGHNPDRAPHQSAFHPACRDEESREAGRRREKIWDKFSFTHAPQSVFAHGKTAAPISAAAPGIHQSSYPDRFPHRLSGSHAHFFPAFEAAGSKFDVRFYCISRTWVVLGYVSRTVKAN